jgi:16S rRNA (cytosine967-C5)-methyltransferase
MPGQRNKSARTVAAEVLAQFEPRRNYAGPILDKLLPQTDEKQRATDLVFGTIRNRLAIDTVIARFSGRPVKRICTPLLNIIRLGTYELVYCPETPEYSIVNEAVEAVKAIGGPKQAGFANAVLRQIARHISNRHAQLSTAQPASTIPQTPLTGCEFDTELLPDTKDSSPDYLSVAFSLPEWLIADWLDRFGLDRARQICLASNRRPSLYLRPNALRTTAQELAAHLGRADINYEIVPEADMIRIKSPQDVTQLPGFAQGLFTVQDITASQVAKLCWAHLRADGGQTPPAILDMCAAPGTKTTQLAELAGDSATIVATDIDAERLKKVEENTVRLGIKGVSIVEYEKLFENSQFETVYSKFGAVLLDVPCSNTGVLARRPEMRFRISRKMIRKLIQMQDDLLEKAADMLKPGGKICYSTCSIQSIENDERVRAFLAKNPGFRLELERLFLPSAEHFDHDGGYVAIMANP